MRINGLVDGVLGDGQSEEEYKETLQGQDLQTDTMINVGVEKRSRSKKKKMIRGATSIIMVT
ncbi:MAG: hypothetical protein Nk1A_5140 [Endomicrobiia bacterium]|nr:MAG: hypothetical protein Nk1A_5140 [Endomicrobiia bacterium]